MEVQAIEMSTIEQQPPPPSSLIEDEEENIYMDMSGFRATYYNIHPHEVISPNYEIEVDECQEEEEKEEEVLQNNVFQCTQCKQMKRDVKIAFTLILLLSTFIFAFLVVILIGSLLSIF